MICGQIRYAHVDYDPQSRDAREKPQGEQDTGHELKTRDECGRECGRRQVQALEEFGDVRQVVELSPADHRELPAPVQANCQQKR